MPSAGGMPRKLMPWLSGGDLLQRFAAKSPMEELLRSVPLHVVLREDLGIADAASCARGLE